MRVQERAQNRCEYCLLPEIYSFAAHQVDHVIAQKHDGSSTDENLAWSCMLCNLRKGSDIASIDPDSGKLTPLFNPRLENWPMHFRFDNALIAPITDRARVTVKLLGINDLDRLTERALLLEAGVYDEFLSRPRPR